MVGTLESLDKSFAVIECLMPEQMKGLVKLHKKLDLHVQPHPESKYKKVVPLSDEARAIMKERLRPEYELYQFVQDRLERQYKECVKKKKVVVRENV